jgi:hypothetical protein
LTQDQKPLDRFLVIRKTNKERKKVHYMDPFLLSS